MLWVSLSVVGTTHSFDFEMESISRIWLLRSEWKKSGTYSVALESYLNCQLCHLGGMFLWIIFLEMIYAWTTCVFSTHQFVVVVVCRLVLKRSDKKMNTVSFLIPRPLTHEVPSWTLATISWVPKWVLSSLLSVYFYRSCSSLSD